eukprot:TRINITY_DN11226_c0_g1_i2.p3 TRINITY_DN11226_c0_g1~~TRINITY_DN11226_c0_g1_i2.p3  ORF type:complete len:100 (+),score=14.14 TRINITY_DN11226_c0_g1_i2:688-987(+)
MSTFVLGKATNVCLQLAFRQRSNLLQSLKLRFIFTARVFKKVNLSMPQTLSGFLDPRLQNLKSLFSFADNKRSPVGQELAFFNLSESAILFKQNNELNQ